MDIRNIKGAAQAAIGASSEPAARVLTGSLSNGKTVMWSPDARQPEQPARTGTNPAGASLKHRDISPLMGRDPHFPVRPQ